MNENQSGSAELFAMLSPGNALTWMFRMWWLSLRSFLIRLMILLACTAVVALIVYLMLRQEGTWLGEIGAAIALVVNGIVAFIVSFHAAIGTTVIRAVESMGLGHLIFDVVFARIGGHQPESAEDAREISQAADGLTAEELRELAQSRAASLLDKIGVGQRVPRPVRWISNRVFGIATWGVVGIVMRFASNQTADGQARLSMDFIRTQLGDQIDRRLADEARANARDFVVRWFGGTALVTLVAGAAVAWFV